jgi:hypothetical protein
VVDLNLWLPVHLYPNCEQQQQPQQEQHHVELGLRLPAGVCIACKDDMHSRSKACRVTTHIVAPVACFQMCLLSRISLAWLLHITVLASMHYVFYQHACRWFWLARVLGSPQKLYSCNRATCVALLCIYPALSGSGRLMHESCNAFQCSNRTTNHLTACM